jgi:hypothetical protein
MRLYQVTVLGLPGASFTPKRTGYAGSMSDAKTMRANFAEALGLKPRSVGPENIEEVDVPTSKPELIKWLNKNAVGS